MCEAQVPRYPHLLGPPKTQGEDGPVHLDYRRKGDNAFDVALGGKAGGRVEEADDGKSGGQEPDLGLVRHGEGSVEPEDADLYNEPAKEDRELHRRLNVGLEEPGRCRPQGHLYPKPQEEAKGRRKAPPRGGGGGLVRPPEEPKASQQPGAPYQGSHKHL